jgi:hypothetical protein
MRVHMTRNLHLSLDDSIDLSPHRRDCPPERPSSEKRDIKKEKIILVILLLLFMDH